MICRRLARSDGGCFENGIKQEYTIDLSNGGTLEHAQQIAGHASPKTTKLYDRTADTVTVDEIERQAGEPSPETAVPDGAADLVADLYRRMPEARITDILLEVDDATRFTEVFKKL